MRGGGSWGFLSWLPAPFLAVDEVLKFDDEVFGLLLSQENATVGDAQSDVGQNTVAIS